MEECDKTNAARQDELEEAYFATYGLRVLTSLRRIIRAVDIHSRKLNREYGITTPQMICLVTLSERGPITLSALAKEVSLSLSTVNGIVDRLEAKALVQRTRDLKDKRKLNLEVSLKGREIAGSAPSLLQDRLATTLSRLPELEQAAIALSLEKVVSLLNAEHLDASPNLMPQAQIVDTKEQSK